MKNFACGFFACLCLVGCLGLQFYAEGLFAFGAKAFAVQNGSEQEDGTIFVVGYSPHLSPERAGWRQTCSGGACVHTFRDKERCEKVRAKINELLREGPP